MNQVWTKKVELSQAFYMTEETCSMSIMVPRLRRQSAPKIDFVLQDNTGRVIKTRRQVISPFRYLLQQHFKYMCFILTDWAISDESNRFPWLHQKFQKWSTCIRVLLYWGIGPTFRTNFCNVFQGQRYGSVDAKERARWVPKTDLPINHIEILME